MYAKATTFEGRLTKTRNEANKQEQIEKSRSGDMAEIAGSTGYVLLRGWAIKLATAYTTQDLIDRIKSVVGMSGVSFL